LIAKWISVDGTMDIDFHIGDFQLDITVAGNPFHQKNGTDIIFGKGLHAFVLNIKLFNQAITRPEIEINRFEPSFPFDFNLPVCTIG
jgi:hypothetical protein